MRFLFVFFTLMFLSSGAWTKYILEEEKGDRFKGASDYNRRSSKKKKKVVIKGKEKRTKKVRRVINPGTGGGVSRNPAQVVVKKSSRLSVSTQPFSSCEAFKKYNPRGGGVSLLIEIPLMNSKRTPNPNIKRISQSVNLYKKTGGALGVDTLVIEIPASALYD